MPDKVQCFVAYSSEPASRAEPVELAIEEISGGGGVDITGWKSVSVGGRIVIGAICEQIRRCQLFMADVTGLNPNVLFELGYAIALDKRVWLMFDPNIERAKQEFNSFQLLTTVGYSPFCNSREIASGFYRDQPYESLGKTILSDLLGPAESRESRRPTLLHLKSSVDTEAAVRIARRVAAGPIPSVIDDPKEVQTQPFSWYVQHVSSAFAVTCHFLSTDYKSWELQNAKHALVAGLAYGLGKPLLMLAHDPYLPPIDYRDLLHQHKTAAQAEAFYNAWLLPIIEAYENRKKDARQYELEERARGELRSIAIGDPIAEFESEEVPDYFVPTAAYNEALRSKHSIFVGKKGTGKTASLFKLSEELRADPRNHICIVKPVDYELEGLLAMLAQQLAVADKGYLIESFWKFLLFTELAKTVYEEVLGKPVYYVKTEAEAELCEFVEQHQSLITPEFSLRLEAAVRRLGNMLTEGTSEARRASISERLHSEMLARLRALLGNALHAKAKVAILVDNLDKSWDHQTDLELLSELLYGLLSVSTRVAVEFGREKRGTVNLSLTLFLRSDIYAAMIGYARERDKLPIRRISWQDPELLRRVVEERFMKSGADVPKPEGVWSRYFPASVRDIPIRDYLAFSALPRPRDLIFLVKASLEFAVNRGHGRIEEADIVSAQQQYSHFALNSLLSEAAPRIDGFDDRLLEFAGGPEIVDVERIKIAMRRAGVGETRVAEVVDLLTELTFLGPETSPGRFDFIYDEENLMKTRVMARNLSEEAGRPARFRVNPAFHAFLEITPQRALAPGQLQIDLLGAS
ncbi:MAG: hypothetical protein ABR865_05485 [Terracidiphilus sp.]|jgi:hypothetical protein